MPLLVTTWYGSFLLAGDAAHPGKVLRRHAAPKDAASVAARLAQIRGGSILDEEKELARHADGAALNVIEKRLEPLGTHTPGLLPSPADARETGHDEAILHEALLLLAVEEAHGSLAGPDLLIVHQVRGLDDVVRTANTIAERLREWYAVHAPEVVSATKDYAQLARLVMETPDPQEAAAKRDVHASGLGVAAPPADAALVSRFAAGLVELDALRRGIEERLQAAMQETAPNLTALTGAMLGARLIAAAGSLDRLATLPAGTVQTLGAENALFRHLREGAPPPKHGILFQYDSVYKSAWWQRGKIARALSGKIAQAARMDAYGSAKDAAGGTRLAAALRERVKEIHRQFPKPPQRDQRGRRPPGPPGPRRHAGPARRAQPAGRAAKRGGRRR